MRRLSLTVLVAIVVGWAAPARALTVAIVRPHAPPSLTKETIVRLSLELASVGFATEVVDATAGGQESSSSLELLAARRRVDAVVAIVGDVAPTAVEVWAIDKATGRSVSRRLHFDIDANAERASETLAIRAMELLRSSLLEIDLTANTRRDEASATSPGKPVPSPPTETLASRPERFEIDVGAAAVLGPGGVGPAVVPVVQVGWAQGPSLIIRAALAGLGTRGSVGTSAGNAEVTQEYLVLGAAYRFRAHGRLRPFVTLSAGALHTSVEGSAMAPNQGRSTSQWSFLLDGGLGASLGLGDRFFLAAAADAQLAEPYPAIRFLESVVATRARPSLLLALTVGAWL